MKYAGYGNYGNCSQHVDGLDHSGRTCRHVHSEREYYNQVVVEEIW